jgi:hypothetical protein
MHSSAVLGNNEHKNLLGVQLRVGREDRLQGVDTVLNIVVTNMAQQRVDEFLAESKAAAIVDKDDGVSHLGEKGGGDRKGHWGCTVWSTMREYDNRN